MDETVVDDAGDVEPDEADPEGDVGFDEVGEEIKITGSLVIVITTWPP